MLTYTAFETAKLALKTDICRNYTYKSSSYLTENKTRLHIRSNQLMPYRDRSADCSESHVKHRNTLCRQNSELLKLQQVVHILITGL